MKRILLSAAVLLFVTVCQAQTPRKTAVKDAKDKYANTEVTYRQVTVNGKKLYQKGDCERGGVDSKYCTFCEDEKLTINCKEYLCDNNNNCIPKPKRVLGDVAGPFATTTQLPKGTIFKNGKVELLKGYTASYTDSNRVVVIKEKKGGVTGSFTCYCKAGQGSCGSLVTGEGLKCVSDGCGECGILVVINPKNVAITKSGSDWKKLILPTSEVQQQEDPDQGGEIFKKSGKKSKQ